MRETGLKGAMWFGRRRFTSRGEPEPSGSRGHGSARGQTDPAPSAGVISSRRQTSEQLERVSEKMTASVFQWKWAHKTTNVRRAFEGRRCLLQWWARRPCMCCRVCSVIAILFSLHESISAKSLQLNMLVMLLPWLNGSRVLQITEVETVCCRCRSERPPLDCAASPGRRVRAEHTYRRTTSPPVVHHRPPHVGDRPPTKSRFRTDK